MRVIIEIIIRLGLKHQMFLTLAYDKYTINIILSGPEMYIDLSICTWFRRTHIILRHIRKQSFPVKYRTHGGNILLILLRFLKLTDIHNRRAFL